MTEGEPKIVARKIELVPFETRGERRDVFVKMYLLDSAEGRKSCEHFGKVAKKSLKTMAEKGYSCEVGVASLSGYRDKNNYVDVATIRFYRYDPQKMHNPIFHDFAWENGMSVSGAKGFCCRKEAADIFGPEADLHRKVDGNVDRYLKGYAAHIDV